MKNKIFTSSVIARSDNSRLMISTIKRRSESYKSASLVAAWSPNRSEKNFIIEFVVLHSIGSTFFRKINYLSSLFYIYFLPLRLNNKINRSINSLQDNCSLTANNVSIIGFSWGESKRKLNDKINFIAVSINSSSSPLFSINSNIIFKNTQFDNWPKEKNST